MNGNSHMDRRRLLGEGLYLLGLLALCVFLLYSPRERAPLVFDSAAYAAQSINLARGEGNTINMGGERYPGYYPAGYPLLIVPVHWVVGCDLQNGVIVNFLLGLVTLLCVYVVGRRVAGPLAGGTGVLLLVKIDVFRYVAHEAIAEMPGVAAVAVMMICVFAGWKGERRSAMYRFLAGLIGGLAVVFRYANFGVPVALVVFAVVMPASRTSRWKTALATWMGVGAAAVVTLLHNQICYGGLMESGYSRLGSSVLNLFSLEYILDPLAMQIDKNPWPILRATFGLGRLHPWPVAVAALAGAICTWYGRRELRLPWVLTLLTIIMMVSEGAFLSLYFYRSPLYLTLYLPLLVVLAGAVPTWFLQRIQARSGRGVPWLPVLPLLLALAYVAPELPEAPVMQEADGNMDMEVIRLFRTAEAALEENAVLVGAANPVLGQYVFASRDQRVYYFMSDLMGGLQRMPLKDDEARKVLEEIDNYIMRMQGENRPVYILTLPPEEPNKVQICLDAYRFLKKRYKLIPSQVPGIMRIGARR